MVSKYLQDLQYMYLYQSVGNTEREADYETMVMNVEDEAEEQSKSEKDKDDVEEEDKVEDPTAMQEYLYYYGTA